MQGDLKDQFLLQEDLIFLNFGSFGACPKPVFEAYQRYQLELERQPVAFLDESRGFLDRMTQVRCVLAEEIGANPDDIVPVTNATMGLNIVAHSLDLQPGDEILITDHEYGALEKTWSQVAAKTGARVVTAEVPIPLQSEAQFVGAIAAQITPRTKVLFLSHITSPSALVFPVKPLIDMARQKGIVSIIDGAHAPGHIPLDLNALEADYYAGNCHKWMMSPKGAGFLWAKAENQPKLEPLIVSHGWVPSNGDPKQRGFFGRNRFLDMFEFSGTREPAAWLAVPDAIAFKREVQWPGVATRCTQLARDAAEQITRALGTTLFAAPEFIAPQMVSIVLPDCDIAHLKVWLLDQHRIEVPIFRLKDHCILRFSISAFNTEDDTNRLCQALVDYFAGLSG